MLSPETVDAYIFGISKNIRESVESDKFPLSSEDTFKFLFAWELGRMIGFPSEYKVDFERDIYSSLGTDDKFLDLLIWTDPSFKIALEFKLPKRSQAGSNTGQTQIHAKVCRDISRLSYLVRNRVDSIGAGYFLCATNEGAYLTEGNKRVNRQYKMHHGMVYPPGTVLEKGKLPNGIPRELQFPNHEIRFEWQGIEDKRVIAPRLAPQGRFAWLKPIKIWA
jgi:hypothetical protein